MKLIIHIGMAKTGSTSINKWLRTNRASLEAEGIHSNRGTGIPPSWFKDAIFQTALHELGVDEHTALMCPWFGEWPKEKLESNILAVKKRMHKTTDLLTKELEKISIKSGVFIHSQEVIYRCSRIQIVAFDKFISKYFRDRTYVVYIRNPADFFVSLYSEMLKKHRYYEYQMQDYSDHMEKCARELVPYGRASSFGHLFEWDNVVGDRLNVRLLECDWLVDGDLIEDFASLVDVSSFCKPSRMNESFAAEYIEYIRFLNIEFQGRLPRAFRNEAISILKNESSGKPKLAASDVQANLIRGIRSELEEKIRKRFFLDRTILFPPKFRGDGVMPTHLTGRRKNEIESEIRVKMSPEVWALYEIARNGR